MTRRLPRPDSRLPIVDGQGRITLGRQQAEEKLVRSIEAALDANDQTNADQDAILEQMDEALTKARAAYDLIGPGTYSITTSQALPSDCRTALVDCTGGPVTVGLPAVAGQLADVVFVKVDASANAMTVDGDGAETISGVATKATTTQWATIKVRPTPTYWVQT